jgi:benzoyl-CoA reductase/2-hydroxyglutaryl-CoA dehydratase subunit BcrC/BadD/HgdB
VVIFCHWGCKETAGASQLMRRQIEEAGWPVLVLDGDGCDRDNCMEGQMSTRFSAFLELLRARREEVTEWQKRA